MSFLLYLTFLIECILIIQKLVLVKKTKLNFSYIYIFFSWEFFLSIGFVHNGILDGDCHVENTYLTYLLVIFATFLLYYPISMCIKNRNKIKISQCLKDFKIGRITAVIIVLIGISTNLYGVYLGGGFLQYIFASYGAKVENEYLTTLNLLHVFTAPFAALLLPYLCGKTNMLLKSMVVFYWGFSIFIGAISGASMSILSPIMMLFFFLYLNANNKTKEKSLIRKFALLFVIGVLSGIIIRSFRSDFSQVSDFSLTEAVEGILIGPTFDGLYNLRSLLSKVTPLYFPDQIILPLVFYLPRVVFPWKPTDLGLIVGKKFLDQSYESMAGFITTPLGDFYYDFGLVGIVIGMLFVGFVFGVLSEKINKIEKNPFHIAVFLYLSSCMASLNSWYTGCFKSIVTALTIIFILIVLNRFLNRFFPKTNRVDIDK